MITNAKVIGLNRGTFNKDSKKFEYSDIFLDVTSCYDNNSEAYGQVVSICRIWKHAPNSVVGKTVPVSIDRYGKVNDIQI